MHNSLVQLLCWPAYCIYRTYDVQSDMTAYIWTSATYRCFLTTVSFTSTGEMWHRIGWYRERIPNFCTWKIKIKQSRNRLGVAQRVPEGFRLPDFYDIRHMKVVRSSAPRTGRLYPRKCSSYSFSLGTKSTPGSWYSRKEYVTEKSSDTTGNWSRDCPTGSTAPYSLRYPRPRMGKVPWQNSSWIVEYHHCGRLGSFLSAFRWIWR
jgi:hypothetical protein